MRSHALPLIVTLALVLTAGAALQAIYMRIETRQVPVSRLLQNLERDLANDPKNVSTLVAVARLHGMAYALKSEQAPAVVDKDGVPQRPWYGNAPDLIPYAVTRGATPAQEKQAAPHLQSAIDYYRKALAIEPANLLAAIGLGWSLQQAGDKAGAIAQYRAVIERSWPDEQKRRGRGLGSLYTEEAAGYLIPLLDPRADAAEIRELEARRQQLSKLPRAITPIAVPLGDDVKLRDIADPLARVAFDADGSGLRREWTWITPDAGWLVYDALDTGRITSALQWFGSVTFWLFWENGYDALAALDDDGDGELAGGELRHLAIWHDRNRNGVSERGEVRPLRAHGIAGVNCAFVPGDGRTVAAFSPDGVRLANGRTRPTYDVILRPPAISMTEETVRQGEM
jgi:tetratricopeptide (TPR) repeat protein